MGDVERVVNINIAVDLSVKAVEDVMLQRYRGFHDEGVEVQPPKPAFRFSNVNDRLEGSCIPLGFWIPSHGVPDQIDLLPTLAPFVSVSLLGAHVCDV